MRILAARKEDVEKSECPKAAWCSDGSAHGWVSPEAQVRYSQEYLKELRQREDGSCQKSPPEGPWNSSSRNKSPETIVSSEALISLICEASIISRTKLKKRIWLTMFQPASL